MKAGSKASLRNRFTGRGTHAPPYLEGRNGAVLNNNVGICLAVPSKDTPGIQEVVHTTAGHIICFLVERTNFGD